MSGITDIVEKINSYHPDFAWDGPEEFWRGAWSWVVDLSAPTEYVVYPVGVRDKCRVPITDCYLGQGGTWREAIRDAALQLERDRVVALSLKDIELKESLWENLYYKVLKALGHTPRFVVLVRVVGLENKTVPVEPDSPWKKHF